MKEVSNMKAKELFKKMMKEASTIEDKENTKLFVSSTVSKYIRNEVKMMVKKNLENTLIDKELGIIDEATATAEIETARLIYRSL
jgi:hypothetical protein